jgi:tRNA threonylcarbamoyladenosine biosynthesis protein TsaE
MRGVSRTPMSMTFDCTDERATERLGGACAGALMALERGPLIVTLSGELGAGKTTLVRAILRGLSHTGPVPSPTYMLLEPYEAGGWNVAHVDFYRLQGAVELENLGLRELLTGRRLILVEWPENAAGGLPIADVALTIILAGASANGRRSIEMRAQTTLGELLLVDIGQRARTGG